MVEVPLNTKKYQNYVKKYESLVEEHQLRNALLKEMAPEFKWKGKDLKKAVFEDMNLQMEDWPQVFLLEIFHF